MEQKKSGKCLVIIDSCIIYFGHQYSVTLSFTCGHSLYDQFLIGMMFFTRVNDLVMKMWGKKIACIWNSLSYFFHTSYKWHRKILDERRKYIKELLEKKKKREELGYLRALLGKDRLFTLFTFHKVLVEIGTLYRSLSFSTKSSHGSSGLERQQIVQNCLYLAFQYESQ